MYVFSHLGEVRDFVDVASMEHGNDMEREYDNHDSEYDQIYAPVVQRSTWWYPREVQGPARQAERGHQFISEYSSDDKGEPGYPQRKAA